ncbi:NUDIX hydrolase [Luteimicrobium sp. DT211]|uniref:NUDIX hydrolase n=1 Tax=Luteimicrobium sp. DT211 TaxID=3393412 RepID=UPI003CEF8CBD
MSVPTALPAADLSQTLRTWPAPDDDQSALRDAYLAFLAERGEGAARRDGGPEHLTASTFVLSEDLTRVLLCYHRKGQFWVQLGGHVEPTDASLPEAALREVREESGLVDVRLVTTEPADLNRHELAGAFGACRAHWDVGYVAFASPAETVVVSDESEDVRWFDVDALPGEVPENLPSRVAYGVGRARAALSARP